MSKWPRTPADWKRLIEEAPTLTQRERQALTIEHVDWPPGATNLQYLTQREMAAKMNVSVVTFRYYLHRAWYKLGLHAVPPRGKIPAATRHAVLGAVNEDSMCDLCQRPIGQLTVPAGELTWADLMGPPRFAERVSIDHIIPVSQGGTHDPANLRVVHAFCNLSDGARVPIEQRAQPPFGYVRRSEILSNGRGPRTWIEIEHKAAAVVLLLLTEYATDRGSIASLCRFLKQSDHHNRGAIAPLLNSAGNPDAEELLYLVGFHSRQRTDRELRIGFAPLVPSDVASECARKLAVRWDRINRARDTRELRLPKGSGPRAAGS